MSEFIKEYSLLCITVWHAKGPTPMRSFASLGARRTVGINPAAAPRGSHLTGTVSRTLSPVIYLRFISRLILHPRQWLKNVIYMTRIKIIGF